MNRITSLVFLALLLGISSTVTKASAAGPSVMQGYSAYRFTQGVGVNTHLNHGQYSKNFSFVNSLILALHFRNIRDAVQGLRRPMTAYWYTQLANEGIKLDLLVDSSHGFDGSGLAVNEAELAKLPPGTISYLEDNNELDERFHNAWARVDLLTLNEIIQPLLHGQLAGQNVKVIGPSVVGNYAALGDIRSLVDFGNVHNYSGGFIPETLGWGNNHWWYGVFRYGDLRGNLYNAKQATGEKPLFITETGETTGIYALGRPNKNTVDEYSQASYDERTLLYNFMHGVSHTWIYDLVSGANAVDYYGFVRSDYSYKPSAYAMQGFLGILADPRDAGSCQIPAFVESGDNIWRGLFASKTPKVMTMGFCKSNGSYDIAVWQPKATFDPNALVAKTVPPISVSLRLAPTFKPRVINLRSQDPNYRWGWMPVHNLSAIPVTDRPEFIEINGPAVPAPQPALPRP